MKKYKYLVENKYDPQEVAYIGDEINDYCLLGKVGIFFAVADANPVIKSKADFILKSLGGCGVLREVAEIILSAQGKFDQAMESYNRNIHHKPGIAQPDAVFILFTAET